MKTNLEQRIYPRIEPIRPENASWSPLALLHPMITLSLEARDMPGITRFQGALIEALSLLDPEKALGNELVATGSKLGSFLHNTLAKFHGDDLGLLTPEMLRMSPLPEEKIYTLDNYHLAQEKVDAWFAAGETIGTIHGAFDFPHLGHALNLRYLYPKADKRIAVIDPNWLVQELKSQGANDRPRVDSLIWKMWQLAVLPTVDMVIEAPITQGQSLNEFWQNMYKKLHIKVLATDQTNKYLPIYQKRMQEAGGELVVSRNIPKPLRGFFPASATERTDRLRLSEFANQSGLMKESAIWQQIKQESTVYEKRVANYWRGDKSPL